MREERAAGSCETNQYRGFHLSHNVLASQRGCSHSTSRSTHQSVEPPRSRVETPRSRPTPRLVALAVLQQLLMIKEGALAIALKLKARGKICSNWDVALALTQSPRHQCPACFRPSADAGGAGWHAGRVRQPVHFWVSLTENKKKANPKTNCI